MAISYEWIFKFSGAATEDLNATVRQLNLQNLSEQVLGFDAKDEVITNCHPLNYPA